MTKPKNTLHRVVMMAMAIIVTLYSSLTFAGPRDWWNKGKEVWNEGKKAKEGLDTAFDFWAHAERFVGQISWEDFTIGRSVPHFLCMWSIFLGSVFLYTRKWNEWEKEKANQWLSGELLLSYTKALVLGFGFELIRTFPGYSAKVYGLLIVPAALVGVGLFWGQFNLLRNLKEAIHVEEFRHFIRHRKLPAHIVGEEDDDEGGEQGSEADSEPDSGPDEAEGELSTETADSEASEVVEAVDTPTKPLPEADPEPEPTPVAKALVQEPTITPVTRLKLEQVPTTQCKACKSLIKVGAKYCGYCKAMLCPYCGGPIKVGAKYCGYCKEELPAMDSSKSTRKRSSPNTLWYDFGRTIN